MTIATTGPGDFFFFVECVRTLPLHCYWILTDVLTYSYVACSFGYLLVFWLMGASKNEPSHNFALDLVMCCIGPVGLEGSPLPFYCLYWICCLFFMEEIDLFIIIILLLLHQPKLSFSSHWDLFSLSDWIFSIINPWLFQKKLPLPFFSRLSLYVSWYGFLLLSLKTAYYKSQNVVLATVAAWVGAVLPACSSSCGAQRCQQWQ